MPREALGALGPVRVERVASLPDGDGYGDFSWSKQRIRILRRLTGWNALQVYRHEWTHMVLQDAGLLGSISAELEEVICDAVANGLIREARASRDGR